MGSACKVQSKMQSTRIPEIRPGFKRSFWNSRPTNLYLQPMWLGCYCSSQREGEECDLFERGGLGLTECCPGTLASPLPLGGLYLSIPFSVSELRLCHCTVLVLTAVVRRMTVESFEFAELYSVKACNISFKFFSCLY